MSESPLQVTAQSQAIVETGEDDLCLKLRKQACDLTTKERLDEASETIRKIQLLTHLSQPA